MKRHFNIENNSNSKTSAVRVEANVREQPSDYLQYFYLYNVGHGYSVRLSQWFNSLENIKIFLKNLFFLRQLPPISADENFDIE